MAPWSGTGGAGFGFLWLVLGVVVVAAVLVGVAFLFRNGATAAGSDRAMELLRERYARGELSDEEFERQTSRLSADTSSR